MFGRSKKCAVCSKKIARGQEHVNYKMCDDTGYIIGGFEIHKRRDCFERGSTLLREQIDRSAAHHNTRMTVHMAGEKVSFIITRGPAGFGFVTRVSMPDGTVRAHGEALEFFRRYRKGRDIVFAFLDSLASNPEYQIPMLLYVDDPAVPPGLLESEEHKRAVSAAEREFGTGKGARSGDELDEMADLVRYANATAISI